MKPREFHERTHYIQQAGKPDVPIYKEKAKAGRVMMCMRPSFMDIMRLVFIGRLWIVIMTERKPLQATIYTTKRGDIFAPVPWRERVRQFTGNTLNMTQPQVPGAQQTGIPQDKMQVKR